MFPTPSTAILASNSASSLIEFMAREMVIITPPSWLNRTMVSLSMVTNQPPSAESARLSKIVVFFSGVSDHIDLFSITSSITVQVAIKNKINYPLRSIAISLNIVFLFPYLPLGDEFPC
jgi:hypothetical protein